MITRAALPAAALGAAALAVLLAGSAPASAQQVVVRPGGAVKVVVAGFAGGTRVSLRLAGTGDATYRSADGRGVLRTTYPAPVRAGRYRLLVVGAAPGSRAVPGNLVVEVPRAAVIGIVVRAPGGGSGGGSGGLGTGGQSTGRPGAPRGAPGAGAGGSGTAGVSVTGVDVLRWSALGAGLTALGAAVTALGRRRRDDRRPT